MEEPQSEAEKAKSLGLDANFQENFAMKGWDGKIDQQGATIFSHQATFHPTKYLIGVLKCLRQQPNFSCYTHTRMISCEEKGLLSKEVKVSTLDGQTITCKDGVEATCVPLRMLSVIAEMEYYRTYCITVRIPKGSYEDCLLYDIADPYHYIRFTYCDDKDDYPILGGSDHKVGQEASEAIHYDELED
jgi:glycine/D-amino acid oxidase-like deaminating enzyme